jgi:hypothetical protein
MTDRELAHLFLRVAVRDVGGVGGLFAGEIVLELV